MAAYDPPAAIPTAGNPMVTTEDSITATGTVTATAYPITKAVSIVTTTPSNSGVRLPVAPGQEFKVVNLGANALKVYPASGGAINGGSADAALTINAPGTADFGCASFLCVSATRFVRTTKA